MILEPKDFVTVESDPMLLSNQPWNCLVAIVTIVLNQKLYDYQVEILRHVAHYKRVGVVASRQIGKSVCIAFLALAWALSKPDQTVVIISTGERQVKELLTKRPYSIKKIFKRSGVGNSIYLPTDEDNADPKSIIQTVGAQAGLNIEFSSKHENAEEIEFHNGSRVVVVPANPDTASGYTAHLLIGDEIAKMPNWPEMQAACFPFVSRVGGNIALFSSYKGKNHWYDMTTRQKMSPDNPLGWKVLKYPVTVNPPPDYEQLKHDLPPEVFNEEYMCIPVDSLYSLFPFDTIDACSKGKFEEWI